MYFFFFIVIGGIFLSSPYWIHSQFKLIYEQEKKWIRLDNTSIVINQKDRALLREIEETKSELLTLEATYHVTKNPLLKIKMTALIAHVKILINDRWPKNFYEESLTGFMPLQRLPVPISMTYCPICLLTTKVNIYSSTIKSLLGANQLILKKTLGHWNYEIKTQTNGHYTF